MSDRPCIYLITCLKTGDKYVGSAGNPRRRWIEHRYWLKRGKHHSYKFQKCWDENGEESFQYSILESVINPAEIYIREQFWIDAIHPELNVAQNVEHPSLGLTRTPETSELIRQAKLGHHAAMTPEQKEELRQKIKDGVKAWRDSLTEDESLEANKRRSHPHTEETKRILSEKSKANNPRNMLGKTHSPETRAKLKAAADIRWTDAKIEKARKRAEWELGRAEREAIRVEKVRLANTGKKRTLEQRQKLREIGLAQQADPEYKRKHREAVLAKMQDPEVLKRLSEAHKGKTLSQEQIAKIVKSNTGKKRSEETRRRLSEARKKWWAERKSKQGK